MIEIQILVPIEDIEIIDSKVEHEKGDRDTPSGYDVSVWRIEAKNNDYLIVGFDDSDDLDQLAIQNWKDK